MTGMASEKQREHIRNYEAQRKAKGWAKVTIWLSPEAVAALEKLKGVHGSKDAAINAELIRAASAEPRTVTRAEAMGASTESNFTTAPPVQDTKAGPVADQVEAYRRERGLKTTAEAVRELLSDALALRSGRYVPIREDFGVGLRDVTPAKPAPQPKPKRSPTLPAGDPVKAATKAPARTGDGRSATIPESADWIASEKQPQAEALIPQNWRRKAVEGRRPVAKLGEPGKAPRGGRTSGTGSVRTIPSARRGLKVARPRRGCRLGYCPRRRWNQKRRRAVCRATQDRVAQKRLMPRYALSPSRQRLSSGLGAFTCSARSRASRRSSRLR
jgi:hypothetical protein